MEIQLVIVPQPGVLLKGGRGRHLLSRQKLVIYPHMGTRF